ncbi:hypothetical protein HanLR1_Chr00c2350g0841351 [Helianthus annuus]|nr:hypothetical protein HanLR1_Chr00c2350g0841351 [Helianthus annuus]
MYHWVFKYVHSTYFYHHRFVFEITGFLWLSGAILIQIYYTLFDNKPTTYLLMLAVFPTLVSLACMSLVHINPSNTSNDKPHLNRFSLIALIIATYLMIVLIFQNIFTFPSWLIFSQQQFF